MSKLLIVVGLVLVVALGASVYFWHSSRPPEEPVGLSELYLRSYDGMYLACVLRRPPGRGPFPAILVLHGDVGGNHFETLRNFIGQPFSDHFFRQGYVVMAADYRRFHFGEDELQDVLVAFERLKSLPYVDPERVSVAGGSHGGYLALMLATQEKPAAVVSMAGLIDIEDLYFDVAQRFRETFTTREEWFEHLIGNRDSRERQDPEADREAVRKEQAQAYRESGSPLPRPGTITYELALELAWRAGDQPELYRRLSPRTHADRITSPVLYVVGGKDLARTAGKELVDYLAGRGVEAEYAEYAGMKHSFYWGIGEQPPEFFAALERAAEFVGRDRTAPSSSP